MKPGVALFAGEHQRIAGRLPAMTFFLVLTVLLVVLNLSAMGTGAAPVGWAEIWQWFTSGMVARNAEAEQSLAVISIIRLPRILLANLTGAGLALSGAALQALFRNPLADPGLLGISSGAALGAGTMIVTGSLWLGGLAAWAGDFAVPIAAFVGALSAILLVQALSGGKARWAPTTTLLAGIAVNALAGAGIGLMSYLADDAALRNFTFWSLGSLASATWPLMIPVMMLVMPGLLFLMREAAPLNMILLGEAEAGHAGVDVRRLKQRVIGFSALCIGALVAVTGIIGFIGLVAPHLVRMSIGPDHRVLLPGSALLGALLLGAADLGARTLAAPAELPIGLLTSLIGGPFFLWLIHKEGGA
jgi:iron complex transport system permease protein